MLLISAIPFLVKPFKIILIKQNPHNELLFSMQRYKIILIYSQKSEFILCNFKILLQICIKIALQNHKFSKTKAKFLEKFISLHDILSQ